MWKINGKIYNLDSFMDKHPGGRAILEACKGDDDLTATFESYHAMSDMKKIQKVTSKYELGECEKSNFKFEEGGFYRVLQGRVQEAFKDLNYKSNWWWVLKSCIQAGTYFLSFILAFYCQSLGLFLRMIAALVSGHFLIQFGFCVMHDASHIAAVKNAKLNIFLSDLWNSLALWDGRLWLKHHVFRHHAFTGDQDLDPDIIHFKPFIRKLVEEDQRKYWVLSRWYPKTIALITTCVFPGMAIGQGIVYNLVWLRRGFIWNMNISSLYKLSWWQTVIKLWVVVSFFYGGSFMVFTAYAIGANATYFACIMPDHDTFETHENRIDTKGAHDWGIIQVRHSGNFATQNPWVCDLFGGINYQIEHHLFPTISHVHFHKLKPIVEKTCKEFDVPYVHHTTVVDAINSTLKNYAICSKS